MVPGDILIVVGDQSTLEALSLRNVCEYFGYKVHLRYIGRPNDFFNTLSIDADSELDYILICNHGRDGGFVMPELEEDLYVDDEPKGVIHIIDLKDRIQFNNQVVLSTACGLGYEAMSRVFLDSGARQFIAPRNYVDGNAAIMFVLRYFYFLLSLKSSDLAFRNAISVDEETDLFTLFK